MARAIYSQSTVKIISLHIAQNLIIIRELKLKIISLEKLINLQAVCDARTTGSSWPGNCLLALELKQPIYGGWLGSTVLDQCSGLPIINHHRDLILASYNIHIIYNK